MVATAVVCAFALAPASALAATMLVTQGTGLVGPWSLSLAAQPVLGHPGVCLLWRTQYADGGLAPTSRGCLSAAPRRGGQLSSTFNIDDPLYHGATVEVMGDAQEGVRVAVAITDERATRVVITLWDGTALRARTHPVSRALHRAIRIAWSTQSVTPWGTFSFEFHRVVAYDRRGHIVGREHCHKAIVLHLGVFECTG